MTKLEGRIGSVLVYIGEREGLFGEHGGSYMLMNKKEKIRDRTKGISKRKTNERASAVGV